MPRPDPAGVGAAVALTFDDGPDPRGTPAILDALAATGATATFFVIAPRAQRHPQLIERIVAEGHGVALHCDEHIRHSERDRAAVRDDTARALARLDALGVRPTLWRTPWGVTEPWTAEIAQANDLGLIGWDVDTHDWRGDTAAAMLDATRHALRADAVVLAHDGVGPGARRDDCAQTARWVALCAREAAGRGLAVRGL